MNGPDSEPVSDSPAQRVVSADLEPAKAADPNGRPWLRRRWPWILLGLFCLYAGIGAYHGALKPLPAGLSLEGELRPVAADQVEFLYDITARQTGQRVLEQMIFDRASQLIRNAHDFILVDLFLFNEFRGQETSVHRPLCHEITQALLDQKRSRPGIRIVVISDPVNEVYGGPVPNHFQQLRAAGIPVLLTNLEKLRDSNPVYSSFWRLFIKWWGNSPGGPWSHPFAKDAPSVSARSWLALLNFKANHRKLIVADAPGPNGSRAMTALVMSANPHDASSAHSNVGLLVRGEVWRDILRSEQAVLNSAGSELDLMAWLPAYARVEVGSPSTPPEAGAGQIRVLTEGKIRQGLLEALAAVGMGDAVDVAMFYLSDREIVPTLVQAADRGAAIRVLLDPNRDAFGYQKGGVPNRPVAAELVRASAGKIQVRWYDTHGEQFHTKLVLVRRAAGLATLFTGSANLTRRNIGDFNLETDLALNGPRDFPALQAAERYFERLWFNRGQEATVAYEAYAETSTLKRWQTWWQERTGQSTF